MKLDLGFERHLDVSAIELFYKLAPSLKMPPKDKVAAIRAEYKT